MSRALHIIDTIADRARHALSRGVAMGINIGLPWLSSLDLRVLCVLVAAHSQAPRSSLSDKGQWTDEPLDAWAGRMVEQGDALYRALRKDGIE